MDKKLTEIELDILKELINIALSRAGDSLSFFAGSKVIIKSMDYKIEKVSGIEHYSTKSGDGLKLLWTEIRGDSTGACFLIFDENEVEQLSKLALPENIYNDPEKRESMKTAVLLEADNIITAAVVTQFANLLKITMLGHIPNIEEVNGDEIDDIIKSKATKEDNYIIKFKASYMTDGQSMEPEFIWLLDKEFLKRVVEFSALAENRVSLNKLKKND